MEKLLRTAKLSSVKNARTCTISNAKNTQRVIRNIGGCRLDMYELQKYASR